jgi:hypothetical protein
MPAIMRAIIIPNSGIMMGRIQVLEITVTDVLQITPPPPKGAQQIQGI